MTNGDGLTGVSSVALGVHPPDFLHVFRAAAGVHLLLDPRLDVILGEMVLHVVLRAERAGRAGPALRRGRGRLVLRDLRTRRRRRAHQPHLIRRRRLFRVDRRGYARPPRVHHSERVSRSGGASVVAVVVAGLPGGHVPEGVILLIAYYYFMLYEFDYVRERERLLAAPACQ